MWTDDTRNAKIKGDQIEVFKILNGYENIDSNIFFQIKEGKITRGHNYTPLGSVNLTIIKLSMWPSVRLSVSPSVCPCVGTADRVRLSGPISVINILRSQ